MDEPATRFGLLRHAATDWNRQRRIQGQVDTRLSALGRDQAEAWGKRLSPFPWSRILASDAGRADETAAGINRALKLPIVRDPRLREQDWGEWTGKTLSRIKREAPLFLEEQEKAGWRFCPPGGEDRLAVRDRSLKAIAEACRKWEGEEILVVTHEGVIKCLLYSLCGRGFLPTEPKLILPRMLHRLVSDNGVLKIEKINALSLR